MMHKFFADLGLFAWAVIAHWQSYLTGGIVTAAVDIVERKRGKVIPWRWYVALFFISAGLVAFFYAWHDEHQNTATVIEEKASAIGALGVCNSDLKEVNFKADFLTAQLDRQQSTFNAQQTSVNSCVNELARVNESGPPKLVTLVNLADPNPSVATYSTEFIILTNKVITPVRLNFACDKPIARVSSTIAGSGMIMGGESRISSNEWHVGIDGPAWAPRAPLVLRVYSNDRFIKCGMRIQ